MAFIPRVQLPSGLAGITAQLRAQLAQIIPRAITSAGESLGRGLELRGEKKFRAGQKDKERTFLDQQRIQRQDFQAEQQTERLLAKATAGPKTLIGDEHIKKHPALKFFKGQSLSPSEFRSVAGNKKDDTTLLIRDKEIKEFPFLSQFKGKRFPVLSLARMSASIEAASVRASKQESKQVLSQAVKMATGNIEYMLLSLSDPEAADRLFDGFIEKVKKNIEKAGGKTAGDKKESLKDILSDELLKGL